MSKNILKQKYREPYACMTDKFLEMLIAQKGNVEIVEVGIDLKDDVEQEYYMVKIYRNEK